ncbi:class I adenylate-forming enzyme family protein [Brevibacillus sp. SYSU BS000544]|uniref:class I adenylate-forming enzyme family protein n=1 Tax=Brevibacillus sp. SYSU BS000544 TaxID=3416443 RepID=UPI003CE52D35
MFIHEALTKAAVEYPDKPGFYSGERHYTYREAEEATNRVARFLLSKGVEKGDRIGIFSIKCLEEVLIIFGAMKIGAVFVHLNPHFREAQLEHIVQDCGIKVLFLHESKKDIWDKSGLRSEDFTAIVPIFADPSTHGGFHDIIEGLSESPERADILSREDPAAIIYTSGSTGKPKGIIVTHGIFQDSTIISAQVLENHSDDRIISVSPFSFDGALSQLFTSVFVGATLVLQESLFPQDVVNTMLNQRITGFHAVPSFWRMLLQRHSPFSKNQYPHLRYVSIIGEAFPHDDLMRLKQILGDTRFYMMYGTTEAFRSTCLPPEDFERKSSSIGKPLPDVTIRIVNENGDDCAPGEVGEIVHEGVFISPGYWNNPEQNQIRFRDHALYTGDLGKRDEEGYLYFVGRKDTMLKSMGYRISPEEIEEVLLRMDGIKEVAVTRGWSEESGERIKALVICNDHSILSKEAVIQYGRRHLPHYMVPHWIEFVSELPRTATFKINRSQL